MPQLEVTFDLDANGILNVSAEDKKTGNKNKIVITNDTGRLSKDEIEKMVKDAEVYAEEDRLVAERIAAKNSVESYCYSMKQSLEGDLKDKIEAGDKATLEAACDGGIAWLEENSNASKEEFEEKKKEIEGKCNPIMMKLYQGAGGGMPGGMPGGFPGAGGDADMGDDAPSAATVEEVD